MRFEHNKSLDAYIAAGDETTKALLNPASPYRHAVEGLYDYFTGVLFAGDIELNPVPAFLAVNAFMLWLASVRMAATGHAAATYPLFRVALESACYSLVTQRDQAKEAVWRDRDDGPEAAKRCREALTGAAKEAARIMNAEQAKSGDIVSAGYQSAIDWGAHPNAKSIFRYLEPQADTDDKFWRLTITSLAGPENTEVRRTLIASLEFGVTIGLVLLRTIGNATQEKADALSKLHDEKERLAASWFIVGEPS
jgi:hypothetical protein